MKPMQESPWTRRIIIIGSLGALVIIIITSLLVSQWIQGPAPQAVATPTDVPTATPLPTATLPPTATPPPFVNGTAIYLVDAQTGKVLYDQNSHSHAPMASLTKIMTAIVAIERADLTQVVPITQTELDEVPADASVALLQAGDNIRLSDLLYALLLPSGSDAAIVIAHAVAGDTPHFVAMMNAKAQSLHLTDTHFTSPHGALVDNNHYASAADLVQLARYAMGNATFAQIVRTPSYTLAATINHHSYPWTNLNELLSAYAGADGIKTGSSDAAGYCLVFSATRKGRRLIGAELGAPDFPTLYADATKLLDLGFAH